MTIAEIDRTLPSLVEQVEQLSARRLRELVADSEESREILHAIEHGLPHGAGVPQGLDGVNVGIGLHATKRKIAALREQRELLVSRLPSEAEIAESVARAEQQAAAQAAAVSRLHESWRKLVAASETLDDCLQGVEAAKGEVAATTRMAPLPNVEYVATVGGAMRVMAASGGALDDAVLRNELLRCRRNRHRTI
jgi:hypothetical protein